MYLDQYRPEDLEGHWELVRCRKKPVIIPVFIVNLDVRII